MLLDTLLFKIEIDKVTQEDRPLLCIPTSKVDMLLHHYHSSLIGGHTGISKCYKTISERFYCPNLPYHIRAYITGCHLCQLFKDGKRFDRPYQKRINLNAPALSRVSIDIKHMPPSSSRYRFILVILCEVTNYVIAIPLHTTQAPEVCHAFFYGFIKYFGSPTHIVCDQDPSFMSSLFSYFLDNFSMKLFTVSVTNHKSLLAEHAIKSISNILMKHLSGLGNKWPEYIAPAMLTYNTYSSTNLDGLSPFELVFGRKAKIVPSLEILPKVPVAGTFKEYFARLQRTLLYLRQYLNRYRDKRADLLNKDKVPHGFEVGQLVYLFQPSGALLQTGSRKIASKWKGPFVIYKAVSPNQFLIMSLDGMIVPYLIEETRLKPGFIQTTKGSVKTLAALKQVLRAGLQLTD
jgi:hypothetical protein